MEEKINCKGCEEKIKELSFPLLSNSQNSYYKGLEEKFNSYKVLINNLIDINSSLDKLLIEEVDKCCQSILNCIVLYYQGSAGNSFNEIFKTLKDLSEDVSFDELEKEKHLFRMRISHETISKTNDMFHIPFDMRYLVDSKRYSITGLPCLYLGSSHFICWYELNKPNFNNLYTSSYKTLQKLKFLDISKDLSYITESVLLSDILSALKFYPITIACNFTKRHFKAKFNDEYIIPNLLLQWVLESNDYSGIKYLSVKYCNNSFRDKLLNYVLPPKDINSSRYCLELSRSFSISNPASFAVLMYGPNPSNVIAYQTVEGIDAESSLLNTYDTTIFGRTEEIIKNLPHRTLILT